MMTLIYLEVYRALVVVYIHYDLSYIVIIHVSLGERILALETNAFTFFEGYLSCVGVHIQITQSLFLNNLAANAQQVSHFPFRFFFDIFPQ